eukprot:TRINITY_DN8444_c0_g1_i3.p1 TRINITY_DN8444_c0_g1~~TRINITY_DN8444_c0_g1_i3.p1  ORF type:complete len:480 (+),score=78.69 TRINITY_DN8444_c0_g1_i3:189-1442(+)
MFAAGHVASPQHRNFAQFAGLRADAEFVHELSFHGGPEVVAGAALPVLRLVGEDGCLVPGAKLPFSLEEGLAMYKSMVRVSTIDKILNALQRQGRISFYMTSSGEEAASVGTIAALAKDDVVWPQYRELGAFIHRGFTVQKAVDQCMSRGDEPGKGRQMPVHYCAAEINMQAVTSPLGTQLPQSVGAGYAFRVGGERRCAVSYFGDGSASEGDFAVALNFAATLKSQALFLCRNNGWAISTPTAEQYAGDGIAARGIAYGMRSIRVDGNDLAAVYLATQRARERCVEMGEPVMVEMMTYRRGHHSTSDDSTRYRGSTDAKTQGREGLEPISRMSLLLRREGLWSESQETELTDQTREEVMSALQVSEAKKFAPVSAMFSDVWAEEPPHLQSQRRELFEHMERHKAHYAKSLARFEDE